MRKSTTHYAIDGGTPRSSNLTMTILWSMRSNAFEKSVSTSVPMLPAFSTPEIKWWYTSIKQCVVDTPFWLPNCLASTPEWISSMIHLQTLPSAIFARQGVKEIGRNLSIEGGVFFGIGMTFASFHWGGTLPCDNDAFTISVTGCWTHMQILSTI